MEIPISNGELIDKISILQIKLHNIKDSHKKVNITKELCLLQAKADSLFQNKELPLPFETSLLTQKLYVQLKYINEKLWKVEDSLRECERNKQFDENFIQLARSVYSLNDSRAQIKKQIDKLTSSDLTEEKSYERY